jgi:hypothetical protein
MKLSKKNLLYLIQENLNEMPMDFDTQDRPHQDVQNKLASGDTPIKKVPLPKTGQEPNKNFQELLASERYRQVVNKVRQYTGVEAPMIGETGGIGQLSQMMMDAHNMIVQTEREHRGQLEQLAIELVMKEMGIPEGSVRFDAKIVGMGEVDMSEFNRDQQGEENPEEVDAEEGDSEEFEVEQNLMQDLETLDLERAKRRLINSMVQGSSKKGHYMYQLVPQKIQQITGSQELINQYGILMSINDTLYWQLSDQTMQMMMGGAAGAAGGSEEVERDTEPPTIKARAINFPILVHELIKGMMELFSHQGEPEDKDLFQQVMQHEDTLEKEMWDLRLGPAIWDRIRNQFPDEILTDENKVEIQNYLLVEVFRLPAKRFLTLMKEVISGSDTGKRLIQQIVDGINQKLNDQDYEETMSQFNDELETIENSTEDDDFRDFLKNMGIDLSGNDEEDDDDDDGGEMVPVRR